MDKFTAMSAFVAVAEQGGFAAASRSLNQSPSVTTRQVATLEEELGVRLLNRSTRSVSLTDAGARYLERARRILFDVSEAERMAEDERGEPVGRLSVSAPLVFGRIHVAPLICQFMTFNPGVTGNLQLSDRQVNLVEEGLDLAVRIGDLPDSADIARKVGETRRLLVASPAYLDAAGRPAHPADLLRHRVIAFSILADPRNWRFGRGERAIRCDVSPAYVTNSADAAIWHAGHNGGITMALSYQVMDAVKRGDLDIVLADFEPEPLPIQFVYPTTRLLSRRVRAFMEMAQEFTDWNFTQL